MNIAIELTEVTPTIKRIPILRLLKKASLLRKVPNGITIMIINVGANSAIGAKVKTGLSASSGIVSSFIINLRTSANGWSIPKGPFLFGPRLTWNLAIILRSNQV